MSGDELLRAAAAQRKAVRKRYFDDDGRLHRADGRYLRSGGTVEV